MIILFLKLIFEENLSVFKNLCLLQLFAEI